ncbi:MAG: hypothetical protein V9G19_01265 [Tetrasphaera sp.]
MRSGAAFCWGDGSDGKLGDGLRGPQTVTAPKPVIGMSTGATQVSAGFDHSCVTVDAAMSCWGSHTYGQLGSATDDTAKPAAVVGMDSNVT